MPYVFQTFMTTQDPETSKRIPGLGKKGRKIPHPKWRFEYTDWQGKRRIKTGHASKTETEMLALKVRGEQDEIRRGYRPIPKSKDEYTSRPCREVIEEYLAWGKSPGGRMGRSWSKDHPRIRRSIERILPLGH